MTKENKNLNKKPKLSPYWIYGFIIAAFLAIQMFSGGLGGSNAQKLTVTEFIGYLEQGDVKQVDVVNGREARVFLTSEAAQKEVHKKSRTSNLLPSVAPQPNYTFEFGELELFETKVEKALEDNDLKNTVQVNFFTEENVFGNLILSLLPFILLIGVWIFIMRRMSGGSGGGAGGQIFNIGKSKAKLFDEKTDIKTSFKDVAGLEGAKEEVQEIVDFLKNPEKYTSLGGKIPKGALLVGQPGTGKTLLAKAVAGEAKVPFFSLSGSDFVEMFVGVGASRVRDLFKQADRKSVV